MGVANQLYESSKTFQEQIHEYDSLCKQQGLPSFLAVLTGSCTSKPTPTENQLCIVSIELALARLWQSWGLIPSVVIGHSLGEYPALCVAGVLSASDMLYLVAKRAQLMQFHCIPHTHCMLSTKLPAEGIQGIISAETLSSLEIACINTANSTVVSGSSEEINILREKLNTTGVATTLLEVPYSFHSRQMDAILDPYEAVAKHIHFATPKIPVASTYLGKTVTEPNVFGASYLVQQARHAVNFPDALESCVKGGLVNDNTLWLESGPGAVCLSFVRATLNAPLDRTLVTMEASKDHWSTTSKALSNSYNKGVHIRWAEFHKQFAKALRLVNLPGYAFDLKNYWIDYQSRLEQPQESKKIAPVLISKLLQQVNEEIFDPTSARVVFVSNFGDPDLSAMARGHVVCGLGLCPSSVYAEMAFSAAAYIYQRQDSSQEVPPMDLANMEIFNPFIVKPDMPDQVFRITSTRENSGPVEIQFHSQDGGKWKQNARCSVTLCDAKAMMADWNSNSYLVQARAQALTDLAKTGEVHKVLRKMAYKLFKTVVDYSDEYQALDEIFMHGDQPEASAELKFRTSTVDGNFTHSPSWIDSLAQLGGFCLNVNPPTGEDVVYLSHGWKSMRIIGPLSNEEHYTAYVHMQRTDESGVYAGNVYVFNDKEVVAVCAGLKFKQMKKSVLETLLGVGNRSLLPPAIFTSQFIKPARKIVDDHLVGPAISFSSMLRTIAAEAGLDGNDLSSDAMWSDLGIDSILTISILGKLRALTSLDLPSSLFTTYPTVGQLEVYLQDKLRLQTSSLRQNDTSVKAEPLSDIRSRSSSSPSTIFSRSSSRNSSPGPFGMPASLSTPPPDDIGATLKAIIIEELGIQASEAQPATLFSDLGLDSLLTISVLGTLREQTGVCLPSSFFTENQRFSDLDRYCQPKISEKAKAVSASLAESCGYVSKPILLQGVPSADAQALFILPDGSGSALSYIDLPVVSTHIPVYALNSPFYNRAEDYTLSFETVAAIFMNTIRGLQPHGPYLISGWSMGGIFAYEVSRQLIEAGEQIDLLLFIDSPCPRTLPPLPAPTLDILEKAGLFEGLDKSGKGISEATRQHFLASVRTLECFDPVPLRATDKLGRAVAIWAKDGMLEGVSEQKKVAITSGEIASEAKNWLFGVRSDYGPAGWDNLVARDVEFHVIGGNHFSVMKSPFVANIGAILADLLRDIRKSL